MKRLAFFLFVFASVFCASAANKAAKELATLIQAMTELRTIHPDSLYPSIVRVETRRDQAVDPTERAITEALLGYLYVKNANTSPAREYLSDEDTTVAIPREEQLKAWSRDDYYRAANQCYAKALKNFDVLHAAKIKEWVPVVSKGKDDGLYDNDMLMVVWRAAMQLSSTYHKDLPSRQDLINYYKKQGNRKAELKLQLDAPNLTSYNNQEVYKEKKAHLQALLDEYRGLDECAGIYLKLSGIEQDDSMAVVWLKEGIQRYPHSKQKTNLQSRLQELQAPHLSWSMNSQRPYPGQEYYWTLSMRNIDKVKLTVYRVPYDFKFPKKLWEKNFPKYLKKYGTLVSDLEHTPTPHHPWQSFNDTLVWKAPDLGCYYLVMQSTTSMKLQKKVQPVVIRINTSRLFVSVLSLPNKKQRVLVNDAIYGTPIEGANVELFTIQKGDTTIMDTGLTDREGKIDLQWPNSTDRTNYYSLQLRVTKGDETWLPTGRTNYANYTYDPKKDHSEWLNTYTDRAIYRPGQTVHIGGVEAKRILWEYNVLQDITHKIELFDVNHKLVADTTVVTDSMGVFSAQFKLPENCLPGNFTYSIDKEHTQSFRVEEYKRPTYEVKTEEAPAVQLHAYGTPEALTDSITLSGVAKTYSGVPVRGAQVIGRYRWNEGWWYWRRTSEGRYDATLDTVRTDEEGRFKVTIPVGNQAYGLRYGRALTVKYTVTSETGETHQAEQTVYLCSKPLTLLVDIPSNYGGKVDKDKMKPWSLVLSTSTGAEVKGDIKIAFKQKGNTVYEVTENSGQKVLPKGVKDLPSGKYEVQMTSIIKGDTATYKGMVTLFSQHDTRPVDDEVLWFYGAEETFSPDQPARIQVGSSRDAYIYYTLMSNDKVVEDRILHLNDSIITLDIPYDKNYGQGLTLVVNTICDKDRSARMEDPKELPYYTSSPMHAAVATLKLQLPETRLKYKWTTFRDKLTPGQKETWQLQLLRPDGTPASANLMATLYDASLDALQPNYWPCSLNLYHNIRFTHWTALLNNGFAYLNNNFHLKQFKTYNYSFATLNHSLFEYRVPFGHVETLKARVYNSYGSSRMMKSTGLALREREVFHATQGVEVNELEGLGINSADEALQGRIAGLDIVEDDENMLFEAVIVTKPSSAEEEADPVVQLRENFNETAFFYPTLRTNAQGEVSIAFTLPESLTTWHLMGLAHTQDMLTTLLDEQIVAQKDLMAQLSLPRFLCQGDKAVLPAVIYNTSTEQQKGRAVFTILDAATEKVLLKQRVDFSIKANGDTTIFVPFTVPTDDVEEGNSASKISPSRGMGGPSMLICRWAAEGSTCSDGEQRYLPVLSNKEWITDTRSLTFTKPGIYKEDLQNLPLKEDGGSALTVEYVSQPAWYAIQALPSLAWPKDDDILSLATAYYAGCISGHISKSYPTIQQAVKSWKDKGLLQKSKLLQNEELKNITTSEMPWVAEAEAETERTQRLSTLFDEATQQSLQKTYLDKMRELQNSDGSFSWYPKMSGNYYLTREVAYLLTRQKVLTGQTAETMLNNAISYIRKDRPTYLGTSSLRYLYVLYQSGVKMDKQDKHNADSLLKVLSKHPEGLGLEDRALASIILKKAGRDKDATRYLESVKKFLVTNSEGLTYFEFPQTFSSINRKQHIHVQTMEAIALLTPEDKTLLDGMRRYLLRQKRTTEWGTPVNTANAVYALVLNNEGLLQEGSDATITLQQKGGKHLLKEEEGSFGFIRERISIDKPVQSLNINKTGNQESWGGIYAQYLAPLDEVETTTGELTVRQQLTASKTSKEQVDKAHVGERLHVRYIIKADRDYEYVVLHAPRSSATEPAEQRSGYRYQNGLGYYRAIKDAATEYFIDRLPRGTYVIEDEVLVERKGEYSTGIAKIQCLYAPEYSAHTDDKKLKVE